MYSDSCICIKMCIISKIYNSPIIILQKFYISCRKQQVANLSIAEVIELSFLGALLERHPTDATHSTSDRCKVIQEFLKTIIEVVPIESAYSCIANISTDRHAQHLCHVMKMADIKPPLSLTFFVNAALAITKLRGEASQLDEALQPLKIYSMYLWLRPKSVLYQCSGSSSHHHKRQTRLSI